MSSTERAKQATFYLPMTHLIGLTQSQWIFGMVRPEKLHEDDIALVVEDPERESSIAAIEAENAELLERAETEAMAIFRDAWAAVRSKCGRDASEVLENMPGWGARIRAAMQADGEEGQR